MQHHRQHSRSRSFVRFIAAATVLTLATPLGCVPSANSGGSSIESRSFTGEQIYEGLFLGSGPVAELVPELTRLDPNLLSDDERAELEARLAEADLGLEDLETVEAQLAASGQFAEYRREVIAKIAAAEPTFFERFGEGIQSGDHLSVVASLDEAADVTKAVLGSTQSDTAQDTLVDAGNPQGFTFFVGPVAVVVAAVYFVVAAAQAAAVATDVAAVSAVTFWGGGAAMSDSNSLARERAVALIVERLSLTDA